MHPSNPRVASKIDVDYSGMCVVLFPSCSPPSLSGFGYVNAIMGQNWTMSTISALW
jgi:hypothetical protein